MVLIYYLALRYTDGDQRAAINCMSTIGPVADELLSLGAVKETTPGRCIGYHLLRCRYARLKTPR